MIPKSNLLSIISLVVAVISLATTVAFVSTERDVATQERSTNTQAQSVRAQISGLYADWDDKDPNIAEPYGSFDASKKFYVFGSKDPNANFKVKGQKLNLQEKSFGLNIDKPFNSGVTFLFATQTLYAPNDGSTVGMEIKADVEGFGFKQDDERNHYFGADIGLFDFGASGFPTFTAMNFAVPSETKVTENECSILYFRAPVPGFVPEGAGFAYKIPVNNSACAKKQQQHAYRIAYNRQQKTVNWLVDGTTIFTVNNLGKSLAPSYDQYNYVINFYNGQTIPSNTEILDIGAFSVGFGSCNFINFYNIKELGMDVETANSDANFLLGHGVDLSYDDLIIGQF